MRTAQEVLKELVAKAQPPVGCPIILTEWKPRNLGEPNWLAACGNMEVRALVRYQEKLAELRRLDMEVDWSSVKLQVNGRHVVHWISDGTAA
jgi:hypothetical protein